MQCDGEHIPLSRIRKGFWLLFNYSVLSKIAGDKWELMRKKCNIYSIKEIQMHLFVVQLSKGM